MISLLRLERKQKNSSNAFQIRLFLFRFYSSGIATVNTLWNQEERVLQAKQDHFLKAS